MNFCQNHWDLLRDKIKSAGLESLVSENGLEAAQHLAAQLSVGETTLSNYDPLMSAMFALTNHAYTSMGPDNARLCIFSGTCPICAANSVHEMSCEDKYCDLKFERFYDNAVADEIERAKRLLRGEI